ncbi:hypothetical protein GGR56DRAFT_60671 [Xylariaceae sp. FL0804]|nr:hypothetical protein GGR56DRAFT_60671 [Xylariaceae sp. FL0804]
MSTNGYGVPPSARNPGAPGDEEQPLLGGRRPSKAGWSRTLTSNVSRDWADLVLLACYIITGLLDSAATSTWGSFVSMQTGNTIYIGLGLAAPRESTRWIKSGVSLACFCAGSVAFSNLHRCCSASPKRRWVLCASFLAQAGLIAAAASVLTFGPRADDDAADPDVAREAVGWPQLVPIALVAFQSCGQAVVSRALRHGALTSVVLTSIYCDLFSDADLFARPSRNADRNRRVAAPLLLLLGAVMGGRLVAVGPLGAAGALWISAALKLLVVVAWLFWPAETED